MDTPGTRLRAAREAMGFRTAKDAALDMKVAIATYAMHEKAERFLPARRAAQYAAHFHTLPEWLLYGRQQGEHHNVPLLAVDGQHNGVYVSPVIDGGSSLLRVVQVLPEDTISPLLTGWLAYFEKPQGALTRDLDGLLCVVGLTGYADDIALRVRRLIWTEVEGCFHLAAEPQATLFDQRVTWAARVIAMAPGGQPGNLPLS
jgi:hypothetical protein